LRYTLKRNSILLLFLLFFNFNLFSNTGNYYSVNKIISFFKLDVKFDNIFDKLTLKKNEKEAILLLNSSFLYLGSNKILINDFIISEQGQYFIPIESAIKVVNYFSFDKNQYHIVDGDIFVMENENNNNIETITENNSNNTKIVNNNEINKNINEINDNLIKAIILDPGHGGKDPGAVGYNDIKEKDIVLRTALLLKAKLEKNFTDKNFFLTRGKDKFIELEERAKIANEIQEKYGQSIFVSIHVNASRATKSYGFETWYLVNNYSRKIVKKGEISPDKDVENVVNSMLNEEIYKESKLLAKNIQNRLEQKIGNVSKNRGIKEEIYFVIKKSVMPAVLVEIGFNTNKFEAIRLTNYSYLDKIAEGIFDGIKDFVTEYEKTHGFSR